MTLIVILLTVVCLAYANGANDNFKGVATLLGSGTTSYRRALAWATLTTFLGSLTAFFFADQLLQAFSGKGLLIRDSLALEQEYVAAVALAAGSTVLLATRIGMPISTTHSLVGALVGAGWAAGSGLNVMKLGGTFLLPLLASPLIAIVVTGLGYGILHFVRRALRITEETCFCVGSQTVEVVPAMSQAATLTRLDHLSVSMGTRVTCHNRYQGGLLGIQVAPALDRLHHLSAGIVCFARGSNDTPKIAALLLIAPQLDSFAGVFIVGVAIALGGLFSARKVAKTMSWKITSMNQGQGFTANVVTGIIVVTASLFGLPVSTTHVSCGALFGIGSVTRQSRSGMIGKIVIAWVTTLPMAAALGAAGYWLVTL